MGRVVGVLGAARTNLVLSHGTLASGDQKPLTARTARRTRKWSLMIEVEVLEYEERLRTAMLAGDVAALDRLIADDLAFVGPDGRVATKEDDLAAHRSGAVRFESIEYGERHTRVLEGAVFTTVVTELVVWVNEQRFEGLYRYLRVWRTLPSGWQVVGGQVSALPV